MRIALDYDGTFTADPDLWLAFIGLCRTAGHEVHVVTMRYPNERVSDKLFAAVNGCVHYTEHALKMPYMLRKGIAITVWIDDAPGMITGGTDVLQWGDE